MTAERDRRESGGRASLDPKVQLSLSATIEVEGKVMYRNTGLVCVKTTSTMPVEVVTQRVQ